jgi:hypothetical protein
VSRSGMCGGVAGDGVVPRCERREHVQEVRCGLSTPHTTRWRSIGYFPILYNPPHHESGRRGRVRVDGRRPENHPLGFHGAHFLILYFPLGFHGAHFLILYFPLGFHGAHFLILYFPLGFHGAHFLILYFPLGFHGAHFLILYFPLGFHGAHFLILYFPLGFQQRR